MKKKNKRIIFVVFSLLSLIGGIPGLIDIYDLLNKGPKLNFFLDFIDYGDVTSTYVYPADSSFQKKDYLFVLLGLTIKNDGSKSLFPLQYYLSIKSDGFWYKFDPMSISDDFKTLESDSTILVLAENPSKQDLTTIVKQYETDKPYTGLLMFRRPKINNQPLLFHVKEFELQILGEDGNLYSHIFYLDNSIPFQYEKTYYQRHGAQVIKKYK